MFYYGYLLRFQFLRNYFSLWKVKKTIQKWNFCTLQILYSVYVTEEKLLLGAIQNHANKDASRKTNFSLFIKSFQSSRTILFISAYEDGSNIYWVYKHWTRLSHTLYHLIIPMILWERKQVRHVKKPFMNLRQQKRIQALKTLSSFLVLIVPQKWVTLQPPYRHKHMIPPPLVSHYKNLPWVWALFSELLDPSKKQHGEGTALKVVWSTWLLWGHLVISLQVGCLYYLCWVPPQGLPDANNSLEKLCSVIT